MLQGQFDAKVTQAPDDPAARLELFLRSCPTIDESGNLLIVYGHARIEVRVADRAITVLSLILLSLNHGSMYNTPEHEKRKADKDSSPCPVHGLKNRVRSPPITRRCSSLGSEPTCTPDDRPFY
jgi:hypothetical protein